MSNPTISRIFFACKKSSEPALRGLLQISKWIKRYNPKVTFIADNSMRPLIGTRGFEFIEAEGLIEHCPVDLIISCGGDGTLLRVASLFQQSTTPLIAPISLGSLGFLSSIDYYDFKLALARIFKGKAQILERLRMDVTWDTVNAQSFRHQVLNEIFLSRHLHLPQQSQKLAEFQFCSAGTSDKYSFPPVIADGLLVSTATGSTGHSLSAGGPLMHPMVDGLLLNAVAPRSLGFRPLILPADKSISVGLSDDSRAEAVEITMDGQSKWGVLLRGQQLRINKSPWPVRVISFLGVTEDWNWRLDRNLKWAAPFRNSA